MALSMRKKAGDLRWWTVENVEPAKGRRCHAQQVVEDVDEDQPGEEDGKRHAGGRHDAAGVVDERAGTRGGEDAERHGDAIDRISPSSVSSAEGRQTRADLGCDRLPGAQGVAELSPRQIGDIVPELHD
jgi:hypothetical protein